MKQIKAQDKTVQKMTRDGAVAENLATGETEAISSREAEADFSASGETAGAAGKTLDRAEAALGRRAAKKAAKEAGDTIREGEAARDSPSSRLHFTEAERDTPELQKAIRKSDRAADRLDAAKENIPKKKRLAVERSYDAGTGKATARFRFEETDRRPNGKLRQNPLSRPIQEAGAALHGKVREVEQENSGVQAGHLGERTLERGAGWTGRRIRGVYRRHKLKPWREAAKAEQKAIKANASYYYQKALLDNPRLSGSPVSRFWQKRQIKKNYAKEARSAGKAAGNTAAATKGTAARVKAAAEKTVSFAASHWHAVLAVLGIGLIIMLLAGGLSSCPNMIAGGLNAILGTTYTAEDADINGVEADYTGMENDLRSEIDNAEQTHPGYDEYRYQLDETGHDPYELAGYLTVLYEDYTQAEVREAIRELFERQYTVAYTETVETRYRTESHMDADGNTTSEEVPYDYYILTVTLKNKSIGTIARETLTPEQLERYQVLMETKGGRDGLFPDSPSISGGVNTGEYTDYDIPPEALTNETFRRLITEAEKYLGYPYVWGGSSPSTSFDCSGFVCYVLDHSGVYPIGRTTAEGIRQQCAIIPPGEARPGDIIFFQGTYDTAGASHVGIYVGDSMMIHCGNPIQYANTGSAYWQEHFMCFGRIY